MLHYVFYLLLVIGLGGAVHLFFSSPAQEDEAEIEAAAQSHAFLSEKRHLPEGLYLLRSEDMVRVPLIDGFQSPLGSESGAFAYSSHRFNTENRRGAKYLGEDFNGIGGESTDLGMSVYAAARGLVVYQGTPSDSWGLVVIIAHRLPDGRMVQSLYAHLDSELVRVGQMVARGELIGTLGSSEACRFAHLYFELIESLAMEAAQPDHHQVSTMNRLNPHVIFQQYPASPHPDAFYQVNRILRQEAQSDAPLSTQKLPEGSVLVNPSQFLPTES